VALYKVELTLTVNCEENNTQQPKSCDWCYCGALFYAYPTDPDFPDEQITEWETHAFQDGCGDEHTHVRYWDFWCLKPDTQYVFTVFMHSGACDTSKCSKISEAWGEAFHYPIDTPDNSPTEDCDQ